MNMRSFSIVMVLGLFVAFLPSSYARYNPNAKKVGDSVYHKFRNDAFNLSAGQFGGDMLKGKKVYGVMIDWYRDGGYKSLLLLKSGDATIYLDNGDMVIGMGLYHDNVKTATLDFMKLAKKYRRKADKTEATGLPDKEHMRFYFLTANGRYSLDEVYIQVEEGATIVQPLFEAANDVITELRKANAIKK